MQRPVMMSSVLVTALLAGCHGPLGQTDLSGQEAAIAEEGQADERAQDDTTGAIATDSLTADGPQSGASGLALDPYMLQRQQELESTRLNKGSAPGAQAILEPGVESSTGDVPADPGSQLPPG